MNPIAFSVLGFGIRWYGILFATGVLLGIFIAKSNCKWRKLDYENFLNVILISLPIGVVGARLYYVIFEFNDYKNNFIDIFNIRQGGLAIHGGILFGIISTLIYTKYKNIIFLKVADVAAPSIAIAQAIGRWGNFFNQEAHGSAVSYDYIKYFPNFIQNGMHINGIYYHPTFLYESIWSTIVFFILMLLLRKSTKKGNVFFTYIGLYSIGRFFIEGLRTDSLMFGPFRMAQLISLVGIIIYVAFFIHSNSSRKIDKDL